MCCILKLFAGNSGGCQKGQPDAPLYLTACVHHLQTLILWIRAFDKRAAGAELTVHHTDINQAGVHGGKLVSELGNRIAAHVAGVIASGC